MKLTAERLMAQRRKASPRGDLIKVNQLTHWLLLPDGSYIKRRTARFPFDVGESPAFERVDTETFWQWLMRVIREWWQS
jgi:hypothetical protein